MAKNEDVVAKVLADRKEKEEAEAATARAKLEADKAEAKQNEEADAAQKAEAEAAKQRAESQAKEEEERLKLEALKKEADAEAERIMALDSEDAATETVSPKEAAEELMKSGTVHYFGTNSFTKLDTEMHPGEAAFKHLRTIAMSYPRTTPDEHVIFGFGGEKFSLGQLRDLTNIR